MLSPSKYAVMSSLIATLVLDCACSDNRNNGNSNPVDRYLAIGVTTVEPGTSG